MNRVINNRVYTISLSLYCGSDSSDISNESKDGKTAIVLNDEDIMQIDIISTLSVPFPHGSIVYSDSKTYSKLVNLIDMPIVHGRISFIMTEGTDVPNENSELKPFGKEYFVEDIFITGIESVDAGNSDKVLVKMNFASDDIIKFNSNIDNVTTFDKSDSDKESCKVNDIIKNLFGAADLSDKLDNDSFTENTDVEIKYISSSNETLITALDYIYRKTFDDNFINSSDCSYVRIVYDHSKHKYVQWKYKDVGTSNLLSGIEDAEESEIRDMVVVDLGKESEPSVGDGKFSFNNSGNNLVNIENVGKVNYTDFDYKENKFECIEDENIDEFIVDHGNEFNSKMVTRHKISSGNGMKYKDSVFIRESSSSQQNGSMYDIVTDSIFNSGFYRVDAKGSLGRKAGDEIVILFKNANSSPYETLKGDYLITAIDNRYVAHDDNGNPSFRSIMDVHRPYTAPDSLKVDFLKC